MITSKTLARLSALLLVLTNVSADSLDDWRALKYGMFLSFGMATFTGRASENDPRNAAEPSTSYAPTDLDVDQWVRAARDAGMKYAVLTAIRVFPAIPAAWQEAVFRDLRAEGAFLVSAERKAGATEWVRVKSLAGEPCRIASGLVGEVHATVPLKPLGNGSHELTLAKGEEALLFVGEKPPQAVIAPVSAP